MECVVMFRAQDRPDGIEVSSQPSAHAISKICNRATSSLLYCHMLWGLPGDLVELFRRSTRAGNHHPHKWFRVSQWQSMFQAQASLVRSAVQRFNTHRTFLEVLSQAYCG